MHGGVGGEGPRGSPLSRSGYALQLDSRSRAICITKLRFLEILILADDSEIKSAVARYLADMIGQLETMAREAKLQLPAYYLAMARTEAELITF